MLAQKAAEKQREQEEKEAAERELRELKAHQRASTNPSFKKTEAQNNTSSNKDNNNSGDASGVMKHMPSTTKAHFALKGPKPQNQPNEKQQSGTLRQAPGMERMKTIATISNENNNLFKRANTNTTIGNLYLYSAFDWYSWEGKDG